MKLRNDAFIELTEAYEILKAPEQRQRYDISLDSSRISVDNIQQSNFDGLFSHSQYKNKK